MTQDSDSEQEFQFSIGWSAWIGMFVVYVLTLPAYGSQYQVLEAHGVHLSGLERLAIPLVPVAILAGSIILHEMAHAIAMLFNNVRVGKIQVEIWGGFTAPADDEQSLPMLPAAKSFAIAVAGPCTNFILAIAFWLLTLESSQLGEISMPLDPFLEGWFELGLKINLIMAVLNILPLYPLDGGHVLRSILTGLVGNARAAGLLTGIFSLIVASAYIRYVVEKVVEAVGAGDWHTRISTELIFLGLLSGVSLLVSFAMTIFALFGDTPPDQKSARWPQWLLIVTLLIALSVFGYAVHVQGFWEQLPRPSDIIAPIKGFQ